MLNSRLSLRRSSGAASVKTVSTPATANQSGGAVCSSEHTENSAMPKIAPATSVA